MFKPFEKYILEQEISEEGIKRHVRVVGKDATEEEYLALRSDTDNPEGVIYLKPKIEYISLRNLLMDKDPEWLEFKDEEWVRPDLRYLHHQDAAKVYEIKRTSNEVRTKELIGNFTPEIAIELLQSRIRASAIAEAKPYAVDSVEEPSVIKTQEVAAIIPPPVQPKGEEPPVSSNRSKVWLWLVGAIMLVLVVRLLFKLRLRDR